MKCVCSAWTWLSTLEIACQRYHWATLEVLSNPHAFTYSELFNNEFWFWWVKVVLLLSNWLPSSQGGFSTLGIFRVRVSTTKFEFQQSSRPLISRIGYATVEVAFQPSNGICNLQTSFWTVGLRFQPSKLVFNCQNRLQNSNLLNCNVFQATLSAFMDSPQIGLTGELNLHLKTCVKRGTLLILHSPILAKRDTYIHKLSRKVTLRTSCIQGLSQSGMLWGPCMHKSPWNTAHHWCCLHKSSQDATLRRSWIPKSLQNPVHGTSSIHPAPTKRDAVGMLHSWIPIKCVLHSWILAKHNTSVTLHPSISMRRNIFISLLPVVTATSNFRDLAPMNPHKMQYFGDLAFTNPFV